MPRNPNPAAKAGMQATRTPADAAMPRPRGRPPTGATPAPDRLAKSRANLELAGGRRLSLNLQPRGAEDLEAIKAHHQVNDTEALHLALRAEAKRIAHKR